MKKQQFIELYMSSFPEDTPQDAENLWAMTSPNMIMAIYDGSLPCSMLVLMKGDLVINEKKYPMYYVYAACTHPDYRKQGKMGHLLKLSYKKALENGRYGLFLKPASEKLAMYYSHEGFTRFSTIKEKEINQYPFTEEAIKLSTDDGIKIRDLIISRYFSVHINWDRKVVKSAINGAINSGGGAYTDSLISPSIFLLAEPQGKVLLVREALGNDACRYIPALLSYTGCEKAVVRLSDNKGPICYGMLLSSIGNTCNTYMGIALD